ncbi:uncharacterized protein LOC108679387 [Hyalella azteca]|uniref:Uncharacterized protein LOC108679387 n=1 Tax=Hyalella azteca TaxID=294128 RepID=A0A8B7PBW9_HYAAZ|nr:uncharacterized protein LOC108679387 [Hyalella azteca]
MARIKASAAVILVSLVCMAWAVVPELNLAFCSGKYDGYYCQHCWQVVYCRDRIVNEAASPRCDADQACTLLSSSRVAACVPTENSAACKCTTNFCDPYALNLLDRCNNITGLYDMVDCGAEDGTCISGECSALPSCDGALVGWNAILPACTDGFYCSEVGVVTDGVHCKAGQYVDKYGSCSSAPPRPCATGCKGLCPDDTDCTRYYACDSFDNGNVEAGPLTCPGGAFFAANADPPSCSGTDESVCAPLTFCNFGSSPATASFSSYARPHACSKETTGDYADSECSQRYLSCRDVGDGEYAWVRTKCPDDHVFSTDPRHPYCVARETVGC